MTAPRRIDHLVLAVRDLEAAARFYDSLGFQVGARNRHPWGTENRLVQFPTSFLELITVADPALIAPHRPRGFSFGAFVRDYLAKGEGLAMLVLDSDDAAADAAAFAASGIGDFEPFFFERKGRRPDGTETHVAFSLAFAVDPRLPRAGFFVCQQHHPEAFWNPALQDHPNGATGVSSVTLGVPRPADHAAFASHFTGAPGWGDDPDFVIHALRQGAGLHIARDGAAAGFTGFEVAVPDTGAMRTRLHRLGLAHEDAPGRVMVGPADAFGVQIAFSVSAGPAQP